MKKCTKCLQLKDESEYYPRKNSKDGLNMWCKKCVLAHSKNYKKRVQVYEKALLADVQKDANLQKHYGLTLKQYEALLVEQAEACAICGRSPDGFKRAFAVDHDHETGIVRGILCPDCNRGLGGFQDKLEIVEKAVEYLKKSA